MASTITETLLGRYWYLFKVTSGLIMTDYIFSLREFYEVARKRYPLIADLIRRIYYGKIFNTVNKKIKGKNNYIKYKYSIMDSVTIKIHGNNNYIDIGPECIIKGLSIILIGDNHKLVIGSACKINRGGSFRMVDLDGQITIGDKTTIENAHIAVTEPRSKVVIGDDCMFAYDIDIRTGDSHAIFDKYTNKRLNYAKDVLIGSHVWIAPHAIVLKGVSLPDNCVVATGSVVVKGFDEVDEGVVIAGNPAKIVKSGISWIRER